jgi:hypothetical protein
MLAKLKTVLKSRLGVSILTAAITLTALAAVVYAQAGGIFPTVLTASNSSGRVTGPVVVAVSARLTKLFGGQPIGGQRLNVYLLRDGGSTPLGTVYTDARGQAMLVLDRRTFSQPGTYQIGWQYDGNGVYARPLPVSTATLTR